MAAKANKVSTSIRLLTDLRERVDDKLHILKKTKQKLSFDAAVHQALELWLATGTPPKASTEVKSTAKPGAITDGIHPVGAGHTMKVELRTIRESLLGTIRELDRTIENVQDHGIPGSDIAATARELLGRKEPGVGRRKEHPGTVGKRGAG